MIIGEYCVYEATYCGFCAYIGSGVSGRYTHVKSGKSHNPLLNEVCMRADLLGEPKLKVRVVKGFRTREAATKFEKTLIRKKKPLFNSHWSVSGSSTILSDEENDFVRNSHEWVYQALQVVEGFGRRNNINPNLIFTPIGMRVPLEEVRWDSPDFNIVALSLLGRCKGVELLCNIRIDQKDNLVLSIKPENISLINKLIGWDKFENGFESARKEGLPLWYREDYNANSNGAAIPRSCQEKLSDSVMLARTLNVRRKIKLVISVEVEGDFYVVYLLNKREELFRSLDPAEAIEFYRTATMRGYTISASFSGNPVKRDFTLQGCVDYETGVVHDG